MTEPTFTFGVKTADDTDSGSSGGDWIHRFAKPGTYRLRFLEEFEDWTVYWEHFSADKKTTYPCTANTVAEKKSCKGCTSPSEKEAKPSKKFLVNAVQITGKDDEQGYAHLWKMPHHSLKAAFELNRDKYSTLTDRDYLIIRTDDGSGVSYMLDREDKQPMDLSVYAKQDHQAALMQEYQEAWDPEARQAKEDRREAAKNKRDEAPKEEPEAKPAVEEEVPDALLSAEERAAKAAKPKLSLAKEPEPEPEEEVEITPSSIRGMKAEGILALFEQAGLDLPEGIDKSDQFVLAEALIAALTS